VHTAVHRAKVRLFRNFPEGHFEPVGYRDGVFEFLHFARNGNLSRNSLHLENEELTTTPVGSVKGVALGTDIFRAPDTNKIYVSYVTIDAKTCLSLRFDEIIIAESGIEQRSVFQTPCTLPPYGRDHAGGRIQQDSAGRMFLTIGDFWKANLAADEKGSFGKIMVGRPGGEFTIFSRGHRNPQGLLWDEDTQTLLATEHGPRGGDEINIIRENTHYGWPHETYGTNYDSNPEGALLGDVGGATYGRHDNYTKPLFAYVPSIGIGQIRKIPRDSFEFPNWVGNYLVAGMAPRAHVLMRVVIEDNRVVVSEPIRLGRIRDFVVTPAGVIIASRNDGLVVVRRDKGRNG
jgi:glucose/arabinose dehydrogenase